VLNKTIYGLLQSAREFYKNLVSVLIGFGCKVCSADPCFWIKYSDLGVNLIAIYVDDCLVISTDEGVNKVMNNLKDHNFGLEVNHDLSDYLSCMIHVDYEKTKFLMKPHLIKTLEEKFGEEFYNLSEYGTPGIPQFKIVRPGDDIERIDSNLQTRYISGVGMLLFLINHSRTDLAKVVRELSKCMDGASIAGDAKSCQICSGYQIVLLENATKA
jgi:hypothetical protein